MYFDNCENVNQVKQTFKTFALKFHPDLHDQNEFEHWNEKMRDLLRAYHAALKACHGEYSKGTDGAQHQYQYNQQEETAVAEKIKETIAAGMPDFVTMYLVGTWLWLEGTKYEDRETYNKLMSLGWKWHGKKKKWFWHEKTHSRRRRRSNMPFDKIKEMYGAVEIDTENRKKAIAG